MQTWTGPLASHGPSYGQRILSHLLGIMSRIYEVDGSEDYVREPPNRVGPALAVKNEDRCCAPQVLVAAQ